LVKNKIMKMILEILLLIVVVIILIYIFFNFAQTIYSPGIPEGQTGSVCFGNNCFDVEIAQTSTQRERGLMGRRELGENKGMLFVFNKEGSYSFWMKNTLIPLDIIWIDSNGKAVFISENTQPCQRLICPSINPPDKAKFVLEINANVCAQIGLTVGSTLKIDIDDVQVN